MSSLQRTKREQEKLNRLCGITERFVDNSKVPHRSDLYGLFDLVSCRPGDGIIGVQACGLDFAAHYRKITIINRTNALKWLYSGGRIELWGWRLSPIKPGSNIKKWKPRVKEITLKDFGITDGTIMP